MEPKEDVGIKPAVMLPDIYRPISMWLIYMSFVMLMSIGPIMVDKGWYLNRMLIVTGIMFIMSFVWILHGIAYKEKKIRKWMDTYGSYQAYIIHPDETHLQAFRQLTDKKGRFVVRAVIAAGILLAVMSEILAVTIVQDVPVKTPGILQEHMNDGDYIKMDCVVKKNDCEPYSYFAQSRNSNAYEDEYRYYLVKTDIGPAYIRLCGSQEYEDMFEGKECVITGTVRSWSREVYQYLAENDKEHTLEEWKNVFEDIPCIVTTDRERMTMSPFCIVITVLTGMVYLLECGLFLLYMMKYKALMYRIVAEKAFMEYQNTYDRIDGQDFGKIKILHDIFHKIVPKIYSESKKNLIKTAILAMIAVIFMAGGLFQYGQKHQKTVHIREAADTYLPIEEYESREECFLGLLEKNGMTNYYSDIYGRAHQMNFGCSPAFFQTMPEFNNSCLYSLYTMSSKKYFTAVLHACGYGNLTEFLKKNNYVDENGQVDTECWKDAIATDLELMMKQVRRNKLYEYLSE